MSVRNPVKAGTGKPIMRKSFIGDPGLMPSEIDPKPLKGSRRLGANYAANKELRKRQTYGR